MKPLFCVRCSDAVAVFKEALFGALFLCLVGLGLALGEVGYI